MKLERMPFAGFMLAVTTSLVALLITATVDLLWEGMPFVLFFAAIVVTTRYAGRLPGFAALIISTVACIYFIIPPFYSFAANPTHIYQLTTFVIVSAFLVALVFGFRKREISVLEGEEQIELERTRLENIVANVPGVVWESYGTPEAADHEISFVSDNVNTLLGYTHEEWTSSPDFWLSVVHPDDREFAAKSSTAAFFGESLDEPREFRWRTKSGNYIWVETKSVAVLDKQGRRVGMRGVTMNITARKRAEDELRESEALLASSQRITHLGSWVMDISESGEVIKNTERWSDEHYRIFGVEPDEFEISDENFYRIVHPEDRERLAKTIDEALEHYKPFEIEHRIIRPDGSERVVLAMAELVVDTETGKLRKLVGSVQDITERKNAEEALVASEERYRSVVETAPDVIVTIDDSSTICFINPAAERIFGYGMDELKGASLLMLMPEYLRHLHDAGMKRYQETGVKHVPWEYVEVTGLHKSGREIPITISFSEFVQNGRRFFTGIIRDITDRKRVMEALRESEERYRELVENALDIIYTHDLTGRYTSVNKAAESITGFTKDEILAMNIADAIPEGELETAKRIIAAKLAGEDAPTHEVELRTKDGQGVMVEVNSRIIYENGTPIAVQGIARDVTERKQQEEAKIASERKYHDIFNLAPVGIYRSLSDGTILTANNALAELLGYDAADELLNVNFAEFYIDQGERENLVAEDIEIGSVSDFDLHWKRKDGSPIWVQLTCRAITRTPDGQHCYEGFVRDVTQSKQMHETLRESELRLRTIIDTEPECVKLLAVDGSLLEMNPAGLRMIEADSFEQVANQSVFGLIVENDRKAFCDLTEKVFQGESGTLEFQLVGHKGTRRWMDTHASPLRDAHGDITALLAITRDVSERKIGEAALLASERKYRDLFTIAPVGIYQSKPDGSFITANATFARMLGYDTVDGLLAKNFADIYFDPDDRRKLFEKYGKKGLTGDVDLQWKRNDGSPIWIQLTAHAIKGPDGATEYYEGFVRDVTKQKADEVNLRESYENFHQLADNISDVFWIRSPDMKKIYYISPAYEQVWGRKLRSDYADPHEWQDLIFPEDRQSVKEAYAGLMSDRSQIEVEFRILRPDGQERWVRARGFQVKDENGEVIRLAGIVTDITEKKQVESALLASEARYHSLFENMIEGYAYCETIFDGDQLIDFIYTEVNGAFEKLTGLSDVSGKKISEIIPEARESSKELFEIYGRVAATGNPERFETYLEPLKLWLSITAYSAGRESFVAVFDNITERKLAQTRLAELTERTEKRERMLTTLLSSMSDMAQIYDPEGRIIFVNQPVLNLWGRALDDVVGKTFHDLEYPADLANKLQRQIEQVYHAKTPITDETPFTGADGNLGIYEYIFTPAIGPSGNVDFVVGSTRDVTERNRAQTLLAESQQRLSLATEAASVGIWDWDLVEDTIKWDDRMYDLYGNHDEDFSGPRQTWNLNHHADDDARVLEELARAMKGPGDFHSEFRVVWPNGEVRHLESNAKVLRDKDGRALRFIGVNWDITERKIAEESLREADQRAIREYGLLLTRVSKLALALGNARDLDTVFEELHEFAHFSTGMDALTISLFDAKQMTRTAAYIWSEGVKFDASAVPQMGMGNSPHSRAILTGEIIITDDFQSAIEGQLAHHLGGDHPQSSLVVPMSVMGRIVGGVEVQSNHLAAFTDSHATALQMAANLAANAIENVRLLEIERVQGEQLRQSQKMEAVGVLAGGIAHDFNNLLTAINGFSDLTLRKMSADEPLRHNIEEVKKAGDRAAELTSQLLAFSRKQVLRPVVHSLNSAVENIENMLRRIIRENIELRTVLDADLGNIRADPGQLEQVIMNLAVNAREAMPDGGILTIETMNVYLDEDYIGHKLAIDPGHFSKLTVTDNGHGMDDSTLRQIFEPFFTTKEVGKGTGLGLSMVYGIVKQSGGDIMVNSEVGHGTTFEIFLPRVDEPAEHAKGRESEEERSGTETILLVEDEEIVRKLVHAILTADGYNVLEAENGNAALAICSTHANEINMLLTDIIMPKMSGFELKEKVILEHPDMKVLFMSGYSDYSTANSGDFDADTAFIEKPFTPDSLSRKVREVLEN